jgi:hypothetical protein
MEVNFDKIDKNIMNNQQMMNGGQRFDFELIE